MNANYYYKVAVDQHQIKSYGDFTTSLGKVTFVGRKGKLNFVEHLPWGWGVRRSEGLPCNNAIEIVHNVDVRDFLPTGAFEQPVVPEFRDQKLLIVAGLPYALACDPKIVKSVTYAKIVLLTNNRGAIILILRTFTVLISILSKILPIYLHF